MKLHLPKTLLVAVLAACVAPMAWAGWGTESETDTFYYTGTETTLNTNGSSGTTTYLKPNGATTGTIGTVTIDSGDTLVITGTWESSAVDDNFSNLTITNIAVPTNSTNTVLEIGGHQNDAGTVVGNQVVTINNGKETYAVAHTKVNAGATLNFSSTGDAINHNKTMVMDVAGTVDFGKVRQTLGNFTLNLNGGTITGSNQDGAPGAGDGYGAIDFKGGITGKITATGTSSITGGVRLRTGITIDVADKGELTIDAITKDGGITKTGAGTLTLTLANTYKDGLYSGNTTLSDGGTIKYAVNGTKSYTGTISGTGNITMSGTGDMTLAKVSGLNGNITVSDGSLSITALEASNTMGVSVTSGKNLTIGSVTIADFHSLTMVGEADISYTTDGSTFTTDGHGFKKDESTYILFDGYTGWTGTIDGWTVESTAGGDTTITGTGSGASFGTVYYVKSGDHTISTAGDYINGRATQYVVESGTTLVIDGDQTIPGEGETPTVIKTAGEILASATGAGNVVLSTDGQLANNTSTKTTGNLTINNDATLTLGTDMSHVVDISKYSSITLDDGTLKLEAVATSFKDVTVTSKSGKITVRNMPNTYTTTPHQLTGTTTVHEGGTLTIDTSLWRQHTNIHLLTGKGNLAVTDTNQGTNADDVTIIDIASLQGFTGGISLEKNGDAAPMTLNATTGGDVSLKSVTLGAGTAATFTNGSKDNASPGGELELGQVSMGNGSKLSLMNVGDTRQTTLSTLSVGGAAVIETVRHGDCWQGTINITSLTNAGDSAVLTLRNGSQTDETTVVNIGGGAFTGTINVESNAVAGDNRSRDLQVNLNHAMVAEKAVITFCDPSTTNEQGANKKGNYTILGVGVDGAKVAGLSGETTNAATIKSTSDDARALEIAATSNYSTNANVETGVNLIKSGTGTQTISGSIGSTDIAVNGGELALTGTEELSLLNLTVKAGATMSVGANGAGTVVVAAPVSTFNTTGSTPSGVVTLEGGSTITGGLDLSNATTLQLDKMTGTDLVTVTGDLTLPEGTLTLNGDILAKMGELVGGATLDIFSVGGAFNYGGQAVTSFTIETGPRLDTVFAGGSSDYYLGYTAPVDGAVGGTVYIGKVIPEPTTATLSLLALAALAARRRRK